LVVTDELEKMTDQHAADEHAARDPVAQSSHDAAAAPSGESSSAPEAQGANGGAAPEHAGSDARAPLPADAVDGRDEFDDDQFEEAEEDDQPVTSAGAIEETLDAGADEDIHMDWYILKVQSNRERSIAEALQRKRAMEGLDRYFDQAIVPTEKVTEFKAGKKRVVERKLYPGYIVVHMHINEDTWFAVRETSGIGDFTGAAGKPTPMLPHEVARIVRKEEEVTTEEPKLDIQFRGGDRVKIKEGNFENFEGEVSSVDAASGRVTVMINIFGRSTPVELEYWHLESV
jgi:transcriptional antiterminator NusG